MEDADLAPFDIGTENPNDMILDVPAPDFLPDQRGQKRACETGKCNFSEPRKRQKMATDAVCIPSQSLSVQLTALRHRVSKLEAENCTLKDELDRVHCISKLRYHQIQHLDNVVQKLCQVNGIDFSDQSYSDPEYFSPFRELPTEIIAKIITKLDCETRRSLKRVCLWWNRATRESTTSLTICCSAGMRGLIGYPRLTRLHLKGMLIGENDFQCGKYMQNVATLVMTNVASVPFSLLANLPYLRHFEIHSPNVTSMEGLCLMRHLEVLVLNSILASFSFPVSACHPKLQSLTIRECACLDVQTRFLGCCKDLEYLHIDSSLATPVSDIDFVKFTPKLNHFALVACCGEPTNSFSLEPLASLNHLEYLNLKGYELSYRPIYSMHSVTRFTPGLACDIHLSMLLNSWASAKLLGSLEFLENEEITNQIIDLLPATCPSLFRVIIMDCPNITQDAIAPLKQLKNLRCLQLSPQHWWSSFSNLEEWRGLCENVQLDDF
jgi:hypothetical protein